MGGNGTFHCDIKTSLVLLDLGGYTPVEDPRFEDPLFPSSYQLGGVGAPIPFSVDTLQSICADVLDLTKLAAPPIARVDDRPIPDEQIKRVITRNFQVRVHKQADSPAQPFWEDSKGLGHPGRLTSCYAGYKTMVDLNPGLHTIDVDLSHLTGIPTAFHYVINVKRR